MRLEPELLGRGDDAFDVDPGGGAVHDDEHGGGSSARVYTSCRRDFPDSRAAWRSRCPVTETHAPPSSWRWPSAWAGTAAAATYVIFTKDGKRIEAREKPVLQGKRLIFLTPLGSPQSIAIDEFDQEKSDKVNKEGLGNAYLLDDPGGARSVAAEPRGEEAVPLRVHQAARPQDGLDRPEPPQGEFVKVMPEARAAVRAAAAAAAEPAAIVMDPQITEAFMRAMDGSNVKGVKLTQIPSGVRVSADDGDRAAGLPRARRVRARRSRSPAPRASRSTRRKSPSRRPPASRRRGSTSARTTRTTS